MAREDWHKYVHKLIADYRVTDGKNFSLKDFDPNDTKGIKSDRKGEAKQYLSESVIELGKLQDKLYAQDQRSVLLVFQAMDAAGKDSTIKHVMSGVNPQGCQVYSFKQPSHEELDHDYMWRYAKAVPERGRIGIFNRSYYEEVLVVRVHKEILGSQRMPLELVTKNIWRERLEDIAAYERYLTRQGVVILKFFLHVSKKEQKKRFLERLELKEKNWKFSPADLLERQLWSDYEKAYEDAIAHTAAKHSPWYIVPADNKWFSRLVVSWSIIHTLEGLDLRYPKVSKQQQSLLAQAKASLLSEK